MLKEKSAELLEFVRKNGGRATSVEACEALGLEKVNSLTGRITSLVKGGYAEYTKKEGENPGVITLTEAGMNYTPEDAE